MQNILWKEICIQSLLLSTLNKINKLLASIHALTDPSIAIDDFR